MPPPPDARAVRWQKKTKPSHARRPAPGCCRCFGCPSSTTNGVRITDDADDTDNTATMSLALHGSTLDTAYCYDPFFQCANWAFPSRCLSDNPGIGLSCSQLDYTYQVRRGGEAMMGPGPPCVVTSVDLSLFLPCNRDAMYQEF